MSRYAQGGDLTQFNQGGLHSQNPLGGVPIGNNNSVEQGETKQDNFIYSNRIFLDGDIVSRYNLPKSLAGKSVADATKYIDNKFKGRNDKISQSTKNLMLSKIAEAQESMKPQEPEMEQQEFPQDTMIDPSQMALGGYLNKMAMGGNPTIDTSDNSTEGQETDEEILNRNKYVNAAAAVARPIANSIYDGGDQQRSNNIQSINAIGQGAGSLVGGTVGGSIGKGVTAATGLYEMGDEAFGKSKFDTSGRQALRGASAGKSAGAGALKGAGTGATIGSFIGPWGTVIGAGVGALVGGVSGFVGGKKDEKAQFTNNDRYALNVNKQYSDNYFALGGKIDATEATVPVATVLPKSNLINAVNQTTGIDTTPDNSNLFFNTKNIVKYQPGLTFNIT